MGGPRRWLLAFALCCGGCDDPPIDSAPSPAEADTVVGAPLPEALAHQIDDHVQAYGRNWASFRFHGVVLVARGDAPAIVRTFGSAQLSDDVEHTPDSRFRIGTLGMPITAAAALALVDRGALTLTDPITQHLPELGWSAAERIRIEDLLGHTSGLPSFTDSFMFEAWKMRPHTLDETLQLLATDPVAPSERSPSPANDLLLGAVIERVTGQSFGDAVRTLVLDPAQMNATSYGDPDGPTATGMQLFDDDEALRLVTGVEPTAFGPAGGFVATADDLRRFIHAVTGDALLSEAARARLLGTTRDDPGFGFLPTTRAGRQAITWSGRFDGFTGAIEHVLDDATTIVVLTNSEVVPAPIVADAVATLAYGGEPPAREEPRPAAISIDDQLPVVGAYVLTQASADRLRAVADDEAIDRLAQVRIVRQDEHLVLEVAGHGRKRMHPLSARHFFFKDTRGTTAQIVIEPAGARRLTLRQDGGTEIRFVGRG